MTTGTEDWDAVDVIEVKEESGEWLQVTVFREKSSGGCCIFYGGSDYEGLPGTYSYVDGVLLDGDGELIETRPLGNDSGKGDELDTSNTSSGSLIQCMGGTDVEHELYFGNGDSPEFVEV